ncbi:methyl-accepting chemotaxis protein [Bermanella sp. R86510]|uniref:methyl-accepting chemotaxis protein n=1 Tax=unclassified Bermanella TaxID=2627862 RepID=UPI0037C560AE
MSRKLIGSIAVAFVLLVVILNVNLSFNLDDMKNELATKTEQTMEQEILGRLYSEADKLGNEISGFINGAFRVPLTVAAQLEQSIENPDTRLTRDQVNLMVESTLARHDNLSSMYAQFEANAYDGADAEFFGSGDIHTTPDTGSLEIYWIRDPEGRLEQQLVEDSAEKNNATVGEFGIREAEWYLCSKDNGEPCISEPYLYEISEGYSELMTSLVVAVNANGSFRGVIGVDVNLPVFQQRIDQMVKALYGGESDVTLLSSRGWVAASSAYKDKLTRPLSESRDTIDGKLLNLHKQEKPIFLHEGVYYVATAIPIPAANTQWSVLVELPESVVKASTYSLIDIIDSNIVAIMSSATVIALVVTILVIMAVVALVRSVTRPLRELIGMVNNLASADGDLTKDVHIDTHQELIQLSSGFSQFIAKLRDIVNQLKEVGVAAKGTSERAKQINTETVQATNDQQKEIDSVVTATNEMSATATEVSQVAVEVADNAKRARSTVTDSQKSLSGSVNTVQQLTDDMQQATHSISEVASRTEDINRILDVIRAIAEQTNLLALNAAIEAARAGEQGRGFAVVADEVRSLASKTQSSTEEINQMIQGLEAGVKQAVAVIESGTGKAQSAMEETQGSYDSLTSVVEDISNIADHIAQVATAAEEQSAVSEEVSRNMTVIGDAARALANLAAESNEASDELDKEMARLDHQLSTLKTQ